MSDKFKGITIDVSIEGYDKAKQQLRNLEATYDRILEKQTAIVTGFKLTDKGFSGDTIKAGTISGAVADIAKRVSGIEHMIDGMDIRKKPKTMKVMIDGKLMDMDVDVDMTTSEAMRCKFEDRLLSAMLNEAHR